MAASPIRKAILGIVALGTSYVAGGAILGAISNAVAQISLSVTIVGTLILVVTWITLRAILSSHPIQWHSYKVKRLGYLPACALAGLVLLLWTPPIVKEFNRFWKRDTTQQSSGNSKEAKVVVLVSDFAGVDPNAYGVTKIIFDQLSEATKGYGDVRIKRLHEGIENGDAAESEGKKAQADIVLWGSYLVNQMKARVTIHFDLITKTVDVPLIRNREIVSVSKARLEDFTVQEQVSKEMSYLVLVAIGLIRIEASDFEGAIASFTRAISISGAPGQFIEPYYLYSNRGLAYLANGDYEKAIADSSTAIRFKRTADSFCLRGLAYFQQNQIKDALSDFDSALSIETDEDTYSLRGLMHVFLKENELALADFERAIAINPNSIDAHLNLSVLYIGQGKLDQAMASVNQIISLEPTFAPAYHNRAIVYSLKSDIGNAIADYSMTIRLDPRHERAYLSRGSLYLKTGMVDQAIADFNIAEELSPYLSKVYSERARAYEMKNEIDMAIVDLTKAIELGSGNLDECYFSRGLIYQQKGDTKQALADYDQAINFNPRYAEAYGNRCAVLLSMRQLSEALVNCNRSMKLNPKNSTIHNLQGSVFYTQGKLALAISSFNRAIELDPNNFKAYYNRALAYLERGAKKDAASDLKMAIQLGTDPIFVGDAKHKLCAIEGGC